VFSFSLELLYVPGFQFFSKVLNFIYFSLFLLYVVVWDLYFGLRDRDLGIILHCHVFKKKEKKVVISIFDLGGDSLNPLAVDSYSIGLSAYLFEINKLFHPSRCYVLFKCRLTYLSNLSFNNMYVCYRGGKVRRTCQTGVAGLRGVYTIQSVTKIICVRTCFSFENLHGYLNVGR
jgi:hypothetical protein